MYLLIMVWIVHSVLYIVDSHSLPGCSLKWAHHVSLHLFYHSAGAVDLRDFMDYPSELSYSGLSAFMDTVSRYSRCYLYVFVC